MTGPSRPGKVVTTLLFGSMRETVPSRLFATQIEPSATATASGPLPTVNSWSPPVRGIEARDGR